MRVTRIGCGLLAALWCTASLATGEPLAWDAAFERALQPGEKIEFTLPSAPHTQGLLVQAIKQGVDLELLWQSGERQLSSNDGDFLRTGEHRLGVNLTPGQNSTLQIRATRPGSRGGRFTLRTQVRDLGDAKQAHAHSADLLETEIAQRLADPARASEASSVDAARQLLALRQSLGEPRNAARALFLLDQLLRRQNRRAELIVLLESALPWLHAAKEPVFIAAAYNNIGMSHWRLGDGRRAEAPLRQALHALDGVEDSLFKAMIDGNLCLTVTSRESVHTNLACSLRNRELSEATGDYARIGVAWNNLAGAYSMAGQSNKAAEGFLKALEFGERGSGRASGDPLMNLGLERFAQGRYEEARDLYARAEAIYRREDNQRNLALVLRHRGNLRLMLGDAVQGRALLQEALVIQRRVRNSEDIIRTLLLLGELERREALKPAVPAMFIEAVALAEVDAEPRTLAQVLLRLAPAQIDTGQLDLARSTIARTQGLVDALHDDYLRCRVQMQRTRLLLATGDSDTALTQIRQALRIAQARALTVDLAEMHALQARALVAQQRLPAAARAYAQGIAYIERARNSIHDAQWRARFVATRRELYEGQAVALAEHALARNEPALVREALAIVAEQRSRSLLETIESRVTETTPRSEDHRRLATREVELAAARWLAQERNLPAAAVATIDEDLRDVSEQLAALERSRAGNAAASTAQTPAMSEVITALAHETAIVHYVVATEHSYAWTVRSDHIALVRLPGRAALEAQITAARRIFDGSGDGAAEAALSELCRSVWQPLLGSLDAETVLLVPDERLHLTPWPALRCAGANPADPRRDLVEQVELTLSPSLRAADEIRRRRLARASDLAARPQRALAIVDPVYDISDERIAAIHRNTVRNALAPDATAATLPRLAASGREAATLKQHLQQQSLTTLTGHQATRDFFLQLPLAQYRLIHLGLHGFVGPASLTDSGIAFSLFDANGKPLSGFLNARSIARLQLDADLVVLAACESAAGETLAGEGLLGTHYAFLAAGADQIVAASAPVSDAVTSRLMEVFYRELLTSGRHPAQALRSAQREIRADARTRDPRYWAGFVVYGF
ncbi:MAG: CHAT domain-containing protein [Rhodanobacteraceae bacterium]|nr:CHAT domain-containing protein [Rhodanobacteraceae bacterium]